MEICNRPFFYGTALPFVICSLRERDIDRCAVVICALRARDMLPCGQRDMLAARA